MAEVGVIYEFSRQETLEETGSLSTSKYVDQERGFECEFGMGTNDILIPTRPTVGTDMH